MRGVNHEAKNESFSAISHIIPTKLEQGFRYEKDCLSKKERTTCIGNAVVGHPVDGNSGAR